METKNKYKTREVSQKGEWLEKKEIFLINAKAKKKQIVFAFTFRRVLFTLLHPEQRQLGFFVCYFFI